MISISSLPFSVLARVGMLGVSTRVLFRVPHPLVRVLAGWPVQREGKTLDPEMQLIIFLNKYRGSDLADLPLDSGRVVLKESLRIIGGNPVIGAVHDFRIPGPGGELVLRRYTPRGMQQGVAPTLLYFHGGGGVFGDLDTHDGLCRFLAEKAGVRVLAVDYRLAPEYPFPAGIEDGWAAYLWIRENGLLVGADLERLAIGGDSIGGNFAAVIAQRAVHLGVNSLKFQLLFYPATDLAKDRSSRLAFSSGFLLTKKFMDRCKDYYVPAGVDRKDPRLSPLRGQLKGVAPAYVVTAGFDPLRDEGCEYAHKLRQAKVPVEYVCEEGLVHSFANMVSIGRSAPRAVERAAHVLRRGLE